MLLVGIAKARQRGARPAPLALHSILPRTLAKVCLRTLLIWATMADANLLQSANRATVWPVRLPCSARHARLVWAWTPAVRCA